MPVKGWKIHKRKIPWRILSFRSIKCKVKSISPEGIGGQGRLSSKNIEELYCNTINILLIYEEHHKDMNKINLVFLFR